MMAMGSLWLLGTSSGLAWTFASPEAMPKP